jgi:hypothetical protein
MKEKDNTVGKEKVGKSMKYFAIGWFNKSEGCGTQDRTPIKRGFNYENKNRL